MFKINHQYFFFEKVHRTEVYERARGERYWIDRFCFCVMMIRRLIHLSMELNSLTSTQSRIERGEIQSVDENINQLHITQVRLNFKLDLSSLCVFRLHV